MPAPADDSDLEDLMSGSSSKQTEMTSLNSSLDGLSGNSGPTFVSPLYMITSSCRLCLFSFPRLAKYLRFLLALGAIGFVSNTLLLNPEKPMGKMGGDYSVSEGKIAQPPLGNEDIKHPPDSDISTSRNLAWCPNAACNDSALCRPCRQRFLFILSTARAASTTLLDMINHLPNVRVGGENNNTLYVASKIETNLMLQGFDGLRSKVRARAPQKAWFHNEIPEQAMACTVQKVLQTINPPPEKIQQQIISSDGSGANGVTLDDYETSQIIGAKMIRIQGGNWTALEASGFFKYNFPCAKYIINTRLDVGSQVASRKQNLKKMADIGTHDQIKRQNDFLAQFTEYMGEEMARMIYMEEWTKNVTQLNEVVEWLGFRNCQYDKVLHNNKNGYEGDESPIDLGRGCLSP